MKRIHLLNGHGPACKNSQAINSALEPLHDFLLFAYGGDLACKTCFRSARTQVDDPDHESHELMVLLSSMIPEAVPPELMGKSLLEVWAATNDRRFGITVKPGRGYDTNRGLGSLGYVPNRQYLPTPVPQGDGVCAVCGGNLEPGDAVNHASADATPCAPTDPGAVHVNCFDRPIPYTNQIEEIEVV